MIKEAQDQQKSYADAHHIDCSYEVGDKVFLRVKPHKSLIKFGKGDKLSPRFVGPFEFIEKKGLMAYRIDLPDSLGRMHDVFCVSILCHYISYLSHVIDLSSLQVSDKGSLIADPIHILEHCT
jgi:hypothetical protein